MKSDLAPRHALESVRQFSRFGYTYLNNAKAGCSSIKYALWALNYEAGLIDYMPNDAQLHGPGIWGPDFKPVARAGELTFSFVRNPFSRVLSCYRDKFAKPTIPLRRFHVINGLDSATPISFEDFLEKIVDTDPFDDDQHWRPQHANLLVGIIPIDFVGYLEAYESGIQEIERRLGKQLSSTPTAPHATNAASSSGSMYTPRAIELIKTKYKKDFELFGYSTNVEDRRAVPGEPLRLKKITDADNRHFLDAIGLARSKPRIAAKRLEAMIERKVSNPHVFELLYGIYTRLGKDGEARALVEKCASQHPEHAVTLQLQARDALDRSDLQTAFARATALVQLKPDLAGHQRLLGRIAAQIGDHDVAAKAFTVAKYINPRTVDNYRLLADVLLEKGDRRGAISEYTRALSIDPNSVALKEGLENAKRLRVAG